MAKRSSKRTRATARQTTSVEISLPGGRPIRGRTVAMKRVAVIRQNPILLRMQLLWNQATKRQRTVMLREHVALRRLDRAGRLGGFVALGQKYGTLRGAADVRHAAKDWLGGYFDGPVVDILIEGVIFTMQRSIKTGLPVGMYWVAGSDRNVKTAIADSGNQITFLLVTPEPQIDTPVRAIGRKEPVWVVSAGRRGVNVEQVAMTALKD